MRGSPSQPWPKEKMGFFRLFGVAAHDLHDFPRFGAERDALLRGRESGAFGLEGEAADAAGVAFPGGGQGRFEASQAQVSGGGAAGGEGATGQMAHQPVVREAAQPLPGSILDAAAGNALEYLAWVFIRFFRADIEPAPGEAHGAIGEQGQHRRVLQGHVGGQSGQGMAPARQRRPRPCLPMPPLGLCPGRAPRRSGRAGGTARSPLAGA